MFVVVNPTLLLVHISVKLSYVLLKRLNLFIENFIVLSKTDVLCRDTVVIIHYFGIECPKLCNPIPARFSTQQIVDSVNERSWFVWLSLDLGLGC
ncbi:hypothetical protein HanIR_Chr07g0314081 [Helianthus annuus]|nr:hypothetical protein HanIR_Chr07g0314081 [Helianthus annuus]